MVERVKCAQQKNVIEEINRKTQWRENENL